MHAHSYTSTIRNKIGKWVSDPEIDFARTVRADPEKYVVMDVAGTSVTETYERIVKATTSFESVVKWRGAAIRHLVLLVRHMSKEIQHYRAVSDPEAEINRLTAQLQTARFEVTKARKSAARAREMLKAGATIVIPDEVAAFQHEASSFANLAVLRMHAARKIGKKTVCRYCMKLSGDVKQSEYPCLTREVIEKVTR